MFSHQVLWVSEWVSEWVSGKSELRVKRLARLTSRPHPCPCPFPAPPRLAQRKPRKPLHALPPSSAEIQDIHASSEVQQETDIKTTSQLYKEKW